MSVASFALSATAGLCWLVLISRLKRERIEITFTQQETQPDGFPTQLVQTCPFLPPYRLPQPVRPYRVAVGRRIARNQIAFFVQNLNTQFPVSLWRSPPTNPCVRYESDSNGTSNIGLLTEPKDFFILWFVTLQSVFVLVLSHWGQGYPVRPTRSTASLPFSVPCDGSPKRLKPTRNSLVSCGENTCVSARMEE